MTDTEIQRIAERAADAAVDKMLLRLGIDPDNPAELPARKLDLEYLRRMRLGSDLFKKQAFTVIASAVTTFIIGAVVAAFYKLHP
jgi:hypothetical protein